MNFKSKVNMVAELANKYWPECLERSYMIVLAAPGSRIREQFINNMRSRGAADWELNLVYDHYELMDRSIEDFNKGDLA